VHPIAQRVLAHIRRHEFFRAGDRVGVAVSGGIDSVAMLRLLLELRFELGIVLSVVHFNHQLRGAESDADEEFVRNLAREHDLEFYVDRADVAAHARAEGVGVETAARELRYEFFRSLIRNTPEEVKIPTLSLQKAQGQEWGTPRDQAPQGLKPNSQQTPLRGAEAPLFHGDSDLLGDSDQAEVPPLHGDSIQRHISGAPERGVLSNQPSELSGDADKKSPPLPQRTRQEWGTLGASSRLDKVATGHTLDDQAETVLMQLIRGAGMRGLGAIYPRIEVEDEDGELCGEIVRPLIETRRCELEGYLKDIDQGWREDSTNADHHFTRNRVRKLLVPLLEKEFNPKIADGLAELAEIAREEEDYWENEIAGWMGTAVHWSEPEWMESQNPHPPAKNAGRMGHPQFVQIQPAATEEARTSSDLQSKIDSASWPVMNASVDRLWFLGEPVAVQRRLIKAIGKQAGIPLEFKHVEEIVRFANDGPSGKELALPLRWKLRCESAELIFLTPDLRQQVASSDYEYALPVPGHVMVNEIGSDFAAMIVEHTGQSAADFDSLLDAESLSKALTIRNWRAGDRFWPVHTKSPKKVKELLTDLRVAHRERASWPVVADGDEIVWVRGFPVSSKYRARAGKRAVSIHEAAVSNGESI